MKYDAQLKEIVKNNNDLMAILHILRDLDLNDWAIGAGMLRDVVWSHLHGVEVSNFRDIDVVYFDLRADKKKDDRIEEFLYHKMPQYPWDVKNQAFVHEWYPDKFGFEVKPLVSTIDAITTWPETATCIGIRLLKNDELLIYAPFGLEDLFEMKLRWNPTRIPIKEFWKRLHDKKLVDKWPKMTVIKEAMMNEMRRNDA